MKIFASVHGVTDFHPSQLAGGGAGAGRDLATCSGLSQNVVVIAILPIISMHSNS